MDCDTFSINDEYKHTCVIFPSAFGEYNVHKVSTGLSRNARPKCKVLNSRAWTPI